MINPLMLDTTHPHSNSPSRRGSASSAMELFSLANAWKVAEVVAKDAPHTLTMSVDKKHLLLTLTQSRLRNSAGNGSLTTWRTSNHQQVYIQTWGEWVRGALEEQTCVPSTRQGCPGLPPGNNKLFL